MHAIAGGGGGFALMVPAAESYDRMIGATIDGRYQLLEKLGEGGMGVVFRGRHTVIEKPVAIKVLKREVARDQSVVKRFLQEAKAASRIGHANIVDVTDFGTLPDGSPYAVMEYIEGVTLARALRDGPMQSIRALPIVAQIARALAAAHEKGIVHRDLKPENIFLTERDGRKDFVKIVDFGIAKVAPLDGMGGGGSRLTRAGSVFGTPEYMAPEQAAGKPDTDHRVDVYALGTILYEMLAGRVPHKGESLVATLAMQMLDPILPPLDVNPQADITPELQTVIMKSLSKERGERHPSMHDFLGAIDEVADGVPLEPMPAGGSSRVTGTVRPPRARTETPVPIPPRTPGLAAAPESPTVMGKDTTGRVPAAGGRVPGGQPQTVLEGESSPRAGASPTVVPGGIPPADLLLGGLRRRSRRMALAAGVLVAAAAGTLIVALIARGGGSKQGVVAPLPAATVDAGVVAALVPADAAVAVVAPPDAAVAAVVAAKADAAVGGHSIGPTPVPTPATPVSVIVKTRPAGGELFVKGDAAGTDGTTFSRPHGTKLAIKCRLAGYEQGSVTIAFDGGMAEATCAMKKKAKCVRDLKNPFDPCPE